MQKTWPADACGPAAHRFEAPDIRISIPWPRSYQFCHTRAIVLRARPPASRASRLLADMSVAQKIKHTAVLRPLRHFDAAFLGIGAEAPLSLRVRKRIIGIKLRGQQTGLKPAGGAGVKTSAGSTFGLRRNRSRDSRHASQRQCNHSNHIDVLSRAPHGRCPYLCPGKYRGDGLDVDAVAVNFKTPCCELPGP